MTEIKTKIPAEMEPAAVGGMVADAKYIIDRVKNKNQTEVNAATDASINQLSNEIDAVNAQGIVPVDSLPAVGSADPRKIYRVVGETSYTDNMVNAAGDGWKTLATYSFPGIDNKPTAGSDNLVKSGGVFYSYDPTKTLIEGEKIDFDTYSPANGYIDPNQKWADVELESRRHIVIPIDNKKHLFLLSNILYDSTVCFLSEYNVVEGNSASVINGIKYIPHKTYKIYNIPIGARYIYLLYNSGTQNRLPAYCLLDDNISHLKDLIDVEEGKIGEIKYDLYDDTPEHTPIIKGLYWDGNFVSSNTRACFYLRVFSGVELKIQSAQGWLFSYSFYNDVPSPFTLISTVSNWTNNTNIEIPEGVTYMSLNIRTDPDGTITDIPLFQSVFSKFILGNNHLAYIDSFINNNSLQCDFITGRGFINPDGVWKDINIGGRYYRIYDVRAYGLSSKDILTVEQGSESTTIAFLSTYNPQEDENTGILSYKVILGDTINDLQVSDGTNYIYILSLAGTDRLPYKIKINGVESIMNGNLKQLATLPSKLDKNSKYDSIGTLEYMPHLLGGSSIVCCGNTVVSFESSSDDGTTFGGVEIRTYGNGFEQAPTVSAYKTHNFGHMNTASYSPINDCLIFGNGSGDYTLDSIFYVIPNFSQLLVNGNITQWTIESTNAIVYDLTGLGFGSKLNVVWGGTNFGSGTNKQNIAYLINSPLSDNANYNRGDTSIIRQIMLGQGSNDLGIGTLVTGAGSDEFNGTLKVIKTYTHDSQLTVNDCIQDAEYINGDIVELYGHGSLMLRRIKLDNIGNTIFESRIQSFYGDNGVLLETNPVGIFYKDGYLYMGVMLYIDGSHIRKVVRLKLT